MRQILTNVNLEKKKETGEDKFFILKTFILLSCHDNDILLKKAISRIPNVSEFCLKQLASLAVISFPKDQK